LAIFERLEPTWEGFPSACTVFDETRCRQAWSAFSTRCRCVLSGRHDCSPWRDVRVALPRLGARVSGEH